MSNRNSTNSKPILVRLLLAGIALLAVSSILLGITEALWLGPLYLGIAALVTGMLLMLKPKFWDRLYGTAHENTSSEKAKRFNRYYFGFRGVLGGVAMITLYWLTHQQLFATIVNWLKRSL